MEDQRDNPNIIGSEIIIYQTEDGYTKIDKIVIVCSTHDFAYPCGICRQVLSEFMYDKTVVLFSEKDGIREFKVKELLPEAFRLQRGN